MKLELSVELSLLLLLLLLPVGSATSNFTFVFGADVSQKSIHQLFAANSLGGGFIVRYLYVPVALSCYVSFK